MDRRRTSWGTNGILSQKQVSILQPGEVLDIGGGNLSSTLKEMLEARLLRKSNGQWLLPSPLLSDDNGLKLWAQITHLPNYYQTRDEIQLLEQNSQEVAKHVVPGCSLLDLGSGDLRKIVPLLDQLEAMRMCVKYFALDLSKKTLVDGMARLAHKYKFVHCFGLWGTFEDGLKWSELLFGPRFFFSLGSSFGNDFFESAVARLTPWARALRPDDRMLLGMDATTDVRVIWDSYHDSQGLFEKFMRNGLTHSNRVLGHSWYRAEDWDVVGVFENDPIMHRFVFRALREVVHPLLDLKFAKGDEIDCYEAFKYGPPIMREQFKRTGLEEMGVWRSPSSRIYQYLLRATSEKK